MKRCHLYLILLFVCQLLLTVAKAQLATDCTLYAAVPPTGNDANNGTTALTPKTFTGAASATVAGSIVCLEGGTYSLTTTFQPPHVGTATAYIVYKAYGDSPPVFLWNGCNVAGCRMFLLGTESLGFPGPHYIEFNGLTLDGNERATNAFSVLGSHHIRILNCRMINTGGAGVAAIDSDYLTLDHNQIFHNGTNAGSDPTYGTCCGWTSGIAHNSAQFLDSYTGLHILITNNLIAGEVDGSSHHTDGNGIILDLSCRSGCTTLATAHTPPVLIMNNVVYQNGGKCILANIVSDFYVINNTCYKNGLDLALTTTPSEFAERVSRNGVYANNIDYAWGGQSHNYSYDSDAGGSSSISYFKEMWLVGGLNFTPSDPSQFFNLDPQFVSPPSINPNLGHQYASATDPALIGTALTLQGSSPAINAGIDPSTISGLPAQILTDLRLYIYSDINGIGRTAGNWNLGAYQFAPPAPPAGLTTTVH